MIAAAWTAYAGWLGVLVVATGFVALFCGLETGIYVLNKIRLDLRAEAGSRQARLLRRLLRTPNNLLAVLLIGTNLSSYAVAFAVTAMFGLAGAGEAAQWYSMLVATPLLFVLGDSVPKDVFRRLAETLTYRLSWLLAGADVLFKVTGLSPFVRAVSWLVMLPVRRRRSEADERLGALFAEGRASGVLTHIQSLMLDRVMRISEVTLADAMVPMEDVVAVGRDIGREELLALVQKNNHSRLPVRDAAGAVVGVLDIYEVLGDTQLAQPAKRMAPPLALADTMTVTEALYRMQRAHEMMAIVQSADAPVGIVTIKDLVEEIVGELEEW
jgi:CBS domain containing-hemolysin-like protein